MTNSPDASLALYVHIPYCVRKCPYCDFNSYGLDTIDGAPPEQRYAAALTHELQFYAAEEEWQERTCHSVFFGGGTPSLFQSTTIALILDAIGKTFRLRSDAEITLEANPGTVAEQVDLEKFKALRAAGINRVSLGAQSFSADKLRALGRIHQPQDIAGAVANVRNAGIENCNLDLIFGVQGETDELWEQDLASALALSPEHLSLYSLTIEPGTEFARLRRKGLLPSPDEDITSSRYRLAVDRAAEKGFARYEISNFAREGFTCRHNISYWDGSDYLGLGAGAHSFLAGRGNGLGRRWSNIPHPEHYMARVRERGDASQRRESIDREAQELEFLYTRLRTVWGIAFTEYHERFDLEFREAYQTTLPELEQEGLLVITDQRAFLSDRGFLFGDYVTERLAQSPRRTSPIVAENRS
ncbi:MAG: radical SAM family heme chaperone HemW [Bdellovibrionales bacterium]|nr:radical SAM family heme chaperone HemW [Bdellovibrionales bacterium]